MIQNRLLDDLIKSFVAGSVAAQKVSGSPIEQVQRDLVGLRFAESLATIAPFLKDESFQEEKEWRLVSNLLDADHESMRYRATNGIVTPFFEMDISELNPLVLPGLRIGPTPHRRAALYSTIGFLRKSGVICSDIQWSRTPYRNW